MPYSLEEKKFILESYFRNGKKGNDGKYQYSVKLCIREFQKKFPDRKIDQDTLRRHINTLIVRFRLTGSVVKGNGTVLSPDMIDQIQAYMERKRKSTN